MIKLLVNPGRYRLKALCSVADTSSKDVEIIYYPQDTKVCFADPMVDIAPLDFRKAFFLVSASSLQECPCDQGAEVAFIGRSNAGKSSAINALTDIHNLARTSRTPGRTRLLNFFAVGESARLVDLPGFGYAKVSARVSAKWHRELDLYLRERRCLQGLVLVMDARFPLKNFDRQMLEWAADCQLSRHLLLTKADKLGRGAQSRTLKEVLNSDTCEGASVQLFSALKKTGIGELADRLRLILSGSS